MPINFPLNPVDGALYPVEGAAGPDDLQYIYDDANNSWNLVAPGNVATTDWVEDLINDDTRNIRRNYDLHHGTNKVTLDTTLKYTKFETCDNYALSSLNTELYTRDGVELPSGESNELSSVLKNGYSATEWFGCVNGKIAIGHFSVLGMSPSGNFSSNFRDTVALYFNNNDGDNKLFSASDLTEGSCIEIQRNTASESNGFQDNAYSVYKINSVLELDDNGRSGVGVSVTYVDSYNPLGVSDNTYVLGADHTFVVYVKAIDITGGVIEGPINIVYDSDETFSVSQTVDPDTMVFKVDTTAGLVLSNETYSALLLGSDQSTFLNGMATVDYVNTRLGLPGATYNSKNDGPYFRKNHVSDETVTCRTIFDCNLEKVNEIGFTIKGIPNPGVDQFKLLYARKEENGEKILYKGLVTSPTEITTKEYVDDHVTNTLTGYVKLTGTDENAKITGPLLYDDTVVRDDSGRELDLNELVPWKKVRDKYAAQVLDSPIPADRTPGVIYEDSGFLYYTTYH